MLAITIDRDTFLKRKYSTFAEILFQPLKFERLLKINK